MSHLSGRADGRGASREQTSGQEYLQQVDSQAPSRSNISEHRVTGILEARRARWRCFRPHLFSDPAWDILLELFAAKLGQRRINIGSLGTASGVPATTTLRWIVVLEQQGLITRDNDVLDKRRVFISLSVAGEAAMSTLLNAVPAGETLL